MTQPKENAEPVHRFLNIYLQVGTPNLAVTFSTDLRNPESDVIYNFRDPSFSSPPTKQCLGFWPSLGRSVSHFPYIFEEYIRNKEIRKLTVTLKGVKSEKRKKNETHIPLVFPVQIGNERLSEVLGQIHKIPHVSLRVDCNGQFNLDWFFSSIVQTQGFFFERVDFYKRHEELWKELLQWIPRFGAKKRITFGFGHVHPTDKREYYEFLKLEQTKSVVVTAPENGCERAFFTWLVEPELMLFKHAAFKGKGSYFVSLYATPIQMLPPVAEEAVKAIARECGLEGFSVRDVEWHEVRHPEFDYRAMYVSKTCKSFFDVFFL
ncbi:hypothetical protein L596_007548 [Steinernema carpocapsae]|uniref:Uncharacterized protein n=1 Tax=Steinernema carpocapsae TaxID=34508 RepID=A0A4U5P9N4_STECR|nr:hypothetical protein L596_007548 [Steinernema carpocapsae]